MKHFSWLVICASVVLLANSARCEVAASQDSYLNALHTSQKNNNAADRGDFDYAYHQDINEGGGGYDYQPTAHNPQYGGGGGYDYQPTGHNPQYGPPLNGPPPSYGPPSYGPPSFEHPIKPVYGPPHHPPIHHPAPFFYHPRESWLLDKFKFKIDLFTIGKILLKLIIFKKIVKFIALIALLLFLPKLKNLVKDDDEDMGSSEGEGRKLATDKDKLNERINEVTNFALTAFDTFSRKYEGCEREQIWCRFQRMFDTVDAKYPYEKIVKLYLPDSEVATNKLAIDH